jgi:hypothetical protein
MGDADYVYAFQKIVMPIAMEFAPELVMSTTIRLLFARGKTNLLQFRPVSTQLKAMTWANA